MRWCWLAFVISLSLGCGPPCPGTDPFACYKPSQSFTAASRDGGDELGSQVVVAPPKPVSLTMRNEYAESIFTVTITPAGGLPVKVFESMRIDGYVTEDSPVTVQIAGGQGFHLDADVISLGEHHQFTADRMAPDSDRTFAMLYDYDLALAEFRLRFGWQP